MEVFLGKEAKVKVRLIGSKLPKKLSEARRRKANKLAKSDTNHLKEIKNC